ncbi:GPI-anchored surface protein, putative [Bodo saltans]|uniref:GPI-anchored surface protein, putative n=1 Tax=Bodo saltans TaxID=75058 RepID=A0A0S4J6F7_BODSA|nr:GPI-anchored surface protein, putative [Bodo saltans]|eukprot:CUG82423.1 GPI-anchored surface protein, putative [Bodo saltans]
MIPTEVHLFVCVGFLCFLLRFVLFALFVTVTYSTQRTQKLGIDVPLCAPLICFVCCSVFLV